MALVLKDRVKETTTTTGTGTITLAGAASGFDSFSSIGDGNTTYYAIVDSANAAWEVGLGTYTASGTTLSRDTVLESSNSDALVDFAAGNKTVFCTMPAEKAVIVDGNGLTTLPDGLVVTGNLTVQGTTTTIEATNLAVADNLIYLRDGETTGNVDLGFAGNYNDGTYAHAGFFRDATDGRWKVFDGYTPEPDAATDINTGHASFALADIEAANFYGNLTGDVTGNADTADALSTARTISVSGDVSGSVSFDGSANADIAVTVADDSHNHVIANVDGLQTALDAKQAASTAVTTTTSFGGDVSGTYDAIVVADDSHNHVISNVDGLQTALDGKANQSNTNFSGDCDTLKTNGFYRIENTATNAPSASYWSAVVTGNQSNVVSQRFTHLTSGETYVRAFNSSWSAWRKVWDSSNDGTGSGLDADTVDGIQASSFVRSDANDTKTGSLEINNGTSQPLKLTTSSSGPWALELYRSDTAFSSKVYNNGSQWYFQHNPSIAGSTNWHSGNDGSGSGLDADTLDGFDLATSGVNKVVRTNSSGYLTPLNWVQIGNGTGLYCPNGSYFYNDTSYGWFARSPQSSNSSVRLQLSNGTSVGWYYATSSYIQGWLSSGGSWVFQCDNSGNVTATGNVTAYSDVRLKENIKPLENALEKVLQLRGVEYTRKDTKQKEIGVIAQEVESVLPEFVHINNAAAEAESEYTDIRSVDYGRMVSVLIEAIKEQQAQIDDLKRRLDDV